MNGRPANAEMVEGYMDGFDLDAPEPSANRSRSYRHGFANGRADKTGVPRGMTFNELTAAAEDAMWRDDLDGINDLSVKPLDRHFVDGASRCPTGK